MKTELNELEIKTLRLIAEGLTDAAIAQREVIEPKSVAKRTQRVAEKLGIEGRGSDYNTRCRLVYVALSRGIINIEVSA